MSAAFDLEKWGSVERQLAMQELMRADDPAKLVRIFDNGKPVLTLRLNEPHKYGATKTREIHMENVRTSRDLLEQMSQARRMFRWVTHPDPNLPRERQDALKDIFWGKFRQMRGLMAELGV